jgi:hypothetical protein
LRSQAAAEKQAEEERAAAALVRLDLCTSISISSLDIASEKKAGDLLNNVSINLRQKILMQFRWCMIMISADDALKSDLITISFWGFFLSH